MINYCAIAQLAIAVPAPAFDATTLQQGAGMTTTGAEHNDPLELAYHPHWRRTIVSSTITQLAGVIASPTENSAINGDGASIACTGADLARPTIAEYRVGGEPRQWFRYSLCPNRLTRQQHQS